MISMLNNKNTDWVLGQVSSQLKTTILFLERRLDRFDEPKRKKLQTIVSKLKDVEYTLSRETSS